MRRDPLERHEDARREIGETDVSPVVARSLVAVFVLALLGPALSQVLLGTDLSTTVGPVLSAQEEPTGLVQRILTTNRRWLAAAQGVEDAVSERSLVVEGMRPLTQSVLTGLLGAGTELAYPSADDWVFYGPDVRYVTGRGFLTPSQLRRRAASGDTAVDAPQPDPRVAILDMHRMLAARGITLIVMPTPVKPSVEFGRLARGGLAATAEVENPSYRQFVDELQGHDVLVFDVAQVLREARQTNGGPFYLATDTHWRPETVELVAGRLGSFIATHVRLAADTSPPLRSSRLDVTNDGDTLRLLGLGPNRWLFSPETVQVRRIAPITGARWQPDPNAPVLLLGDSFTNVYSLETMGWGESAGLAEQLSHELGRPIDRISQNDAGAHTSRELLARELRRGGPGRLAGKRVVIFQFANRELASGDWRVIDLRPDPTRPDLSTFAVPDDRGIIDVAGTVRAVGPIPTPGSVPYKDQIVAVHVENLTVEPGTTPLAGTEALVYLWGMQDDELTPIGGYRAGDRIALRLEAWSNVAGDLDGVNRGEVDDPTVQLAEPWWGQLREVLP